MLVYIEKNPQFISQLYKYTYEHCAVQTSDAANVCDLCLRPAASVRHCLSDAVQHQLHVAAHPPLQPGRAARHHRNAEEGPFPLQVGLVHIQIYNIYKKYILSSVI